VILGIVVPERNGQTYGCSSPNWRYFILIHVTESSFLDMDLNIICALLLYMVAFQDIKVIFQD